ADRGHRPGSAKATGLPVTGPRLIDQEGADLLRRAGHRRLHRPPLRTLSARAAHRYSPVTQAVPGSGVWDGLDVETWGGESGPGCTGLGCSAYGCSATHVRAPPGAGAAGAVTTGTAGTTSAMSPRGNHTRAER